MAGDDLHRTIDVENEVQTAEYGLLVPHARETSSCHAVDVDSVDAHGIEMAHPERNIGTDAARTMHEDHRRPFAGALRNTQFDTDRHLFAIGIADEELLIAEPKRLDGM